MIPTKEQIIEKLKGVKDPELGIDVWTLGLIYKTEASEDGIDILMTFTSPFCPFTDELLSSVEKALKTLHPEVRVDVTFTPAWEPSQELRTSLGL